MTEEEYLIQQLDILKREYEKVAKPIVDRLVRIRSMQTDVGIRIIYDEWSALQDNEVMK